MKTAAAAWLPALCVCALFAPAAVAQMEQPPPVPRFERGSGTVAAGTEFFDRIVYVPAMINGAGPFTFVLDTGAGQFSALDYSVASSLGLRQTLVARGGGAGEDTVGIYLVDSAAVSLPGISFEPRAVAGIPLHRMDPHWGKRKDGLIGGDLLSTLVTVIDYERGRLEFHDASSYEYRGPGERIPVHIAGGYIFIEAGVLLHGVDEPVDALLMLDTGVRISLFNSPFSTENALPARSPSTVSGMTGFGLGGISRGVVGRVRGIRIGSLLLENPVVNFSADEAGALSSPDFSGIVGADILSRFTVVLDYRRSQIFLEKNAGFGAPFEFDMCGIRFLMEGERFDTFRVFRIYDGSPAAEAGIEEGDVVTEIDGRAAAGFTWQDLREYLMREGATVRFTIERDGATFDVSIRLRRLV